MGGRHRHPRHPHPDSDIVYRIQAADIRAVITLDDAEMDSAMDEAMARHALIVKHLITVGAAHGRWQSLHEQMQRFPPRLHAPPGRYATLAPRPFLIHLYFRYDGMPKMVLHNFTYLPGPTS